MQDVLMTFGDLQGFRKECSVPLLLVLLSVVKLRDGFVRVPSGRALLYWPTAVTAAVRATEHVASERRLLLSARDRGRYLGLQPHVLDVLEVVEAVHVHPAAAVIVLGRQLALSILELQALKVVHDRPHVSLVHGQDVVLPAVLRGGLVHAGVEAAVQLCEHVGSVQGLQARQLHPAAATLLQLVQDELMIRKAVFSRGHGLEQRREATLTLHVYERLVLGLPVQRREGFALEDQAQWQTGAGILAASDARPQGEVVHELQQLEILAGCTR